MDPFQHARQLYSDGRVHDALEVAQSGCEQHPRDPEGWWLLAQISRHVGLEQASDLAFRRAAQLSGRATPVRVDAERFRALVRDAAGDGRAVRILALPDAPTIASGVAPDALSSDGGDGSRTLYQTNLENACRDEAELSALIARELAGRR